MNLLKACRKHGKNIEEERKHICHLCGKLLSSDKSLKRHSNLHSGKKSHGCTKCNKSFTQSGSLKTHMLIHKEEKSIKCMQCNIFFLSAGTLKNHMKNHKEESLYSKCQHCEKCFLKPGNLNKHMLIHTQAIEAVDLLSSLPIELVVMLLCYCDLGAAVSLGQTCCRLLQVVSLPRVWGKVMRRSSMERLGEEEVLLIMDQMMEFFDLATDPQPLMTDLWTTIYSRFPAKAWNSVTVSQGHNCHLQAVSTDGLVLLGKSKAKVAIQEAKIEGFLGVNISYGLSELGGPLLLLLSSLASQQPLPVERLSTGQVRLASERDGVAQGPTGPL